MCYWVTKMNAVKGVRHVVHVIAVISRHVIRATNEFETDDVWRTYYLL